jgi:hypothetical protein
MTLKNYFSMLIYLLKNMQNELSVITINRNNSEVLSDVCLYEKISFSIFHILDFLLRDSDNLFW